MSQRGQAMVVALALILALMVLVAATQSQAVALLALSRAERDHERALQAAEAGGNAYLNRLVWGEALPGEAIALLPPLRPLLVLPEENAFRRDVRSGVLRLTRYPPDAPDQGYYAAHRAEPDGTLRVVSFGWSRGIVRRVTVVARPFSLFARAGLYGLGGEPGTGYAWRIGPLDGRPSSITGPLGTEGPAASSPDTRFSGGPLFVSGPAAEFSPVPGAPEQVRSERRVRIPTADEVADRLTGAGQGVEYYRARNDNATGLRYLARDPATGVLRELPGDYRVLSGHRPYDLTWPDGEKLARAGLKEEEVFAGIRVYPGSYYFERIEMRAGDQLYIRTYSDADRGIAGRVAEIAGDPPNPNSGQGPSRITRFWIGHSAAGLVPDSLLGGEVVLELPESASRFRIYSGGRGTLRLAGSGRHGAFRACILAYGRDAVGAFGRVSLEGSTLRGAVVAWQAALAGAAVEHEKPELAPEDLIAYQVTDWTEL